MAEPSKEKVFGKNLRFIRNDGDDYPILLHAPIDGVDRLSIYYHSQIDCLFTGDQEDTSGIRLYNGIIIPVRMGLLELNRTLRSPDFRNDDVIDLSVATEKPVSANENEITVGALTIGAKQSDGSIFAGLTADGKQQIFAMPTDLDVTMTFNDAAKAVKKLNNNKTLGHDDWQIPSLENVRILQKNQNEGALKGTFKTADASGSFFPDWYWSSTEDRDFSSSVHGVRFSDGDEYWDRKGNVRLSCRPVRLVAALAAPAPK